MTSFVSILAILVVIIVSHPQKLNPKQQQKLDMRWSADEKRKGEQPDFDRFQACDYLDLGEVGHRQRSDFDCKPEDKFVFKVVFGISLLYIHMGQFLQSSESSESLSKKFFLALHGDQMDRLFQLLSTVLKRFCPLDSKNIFNRQDRQICH